MQVIKLSPATGPHRPATLTSLPCRGRMTVIAISHRADYIFEATRQQSNTNHYTPHLEPIFLDTQKRIR